MNALFVGLPLLIIVTRCLSGLRDCRPSVPTSYEPTAFRPVWPTDSVPITLN